MIWLFVFLSILSAFLISYRPSVFRPDDCLFPLSLSVIVLFFLFFRCRSSTEISKNVQGTPGQCPPSMDTTGAYSLFPRNGNNFTVGLVLGCGLKKSGLEETSLLQDWPPIRLMLIYPEMASKPTKLSTNFLWVLGLLMLSWWITSGQE